jgi:hypothetical protein
MLQGDGDWVSISEAARRLGVSRAAIHNRIKRRTLVTMSDNHGHPLVRMPITGDVTVSGVALRKVTDETVTEPRQSAASAPEAVPLSPLHREIVEALQAANAAAVAAVLAAHREQIEQLRADHLHQIGKLRSDHQDDAERLKTWWTEQHQGELERLERRYKTTVEALQAAHSAAQESAQNQVEQLRADIAEQRARHDGELVAERERCEVRMDELHNDLKEERHRHLVDLVAERQRHKDEIAQFRADHAAQRRGDMVWVALVGLLALAVILVVGRWIVTGH